MASASRTVVLMYHRVASEQPDPFALQVSPEHFADHLQVLRQRAQVIPLGEALSPSSHARAVITLDDGFVDNLTTAKPLLEDAGLPATVFVTAGKLADDHTAFWQDRLIGLLLAGEPDAPHVTITVRGRELVAHVGTETSRTRALEFFHHHLRRLPTSEIDEALVELAESVGHGPIVPQHTRPMNPTEVRELVKGGLIAVGAHTMTHSMLSCLDEEDQRWELAESRRQLEAFLGRPVPHFAYPFGNRSAFDESTVRIAESAFDLALISYGGAIGVDASPWRLPRCYVGDWSTEELGHHLDTWLR